jgi:aminoglycoside phosphotransferase
MLYIPEKIKKIVDNQIYTRNEIEMSKSDVLIFSKYVLKIQKHTVETDNERDIAAWLNGRISVPQILEYCVENETAYTLMTRVNGKMLCDEEFLSNFAKMIRHVSEGIKQLWNVNVDDCPQKVSRLDERLKEARRNVEKWFG